ncbi:hypothetical protein ACH5RR_012915 [Cinchona calisaya]|uniref:RING-CH-type domain-containing protein n=1 Tax=Cinchona calisaya TaxID=153742 RepID=A0ABD3AAK5_9GENT
MDKERSSQSHDEHIMVCSSTENEESRSNSILHQIIDNEVGAAACRVCQCTEAEKKGNAALGFLGIIPPSDDVHNNKQEVKLNNENVLKDAGKDSLTIKNMKKSGYVEFVSPKGEVFVCNTDVEMGYDRNEDTLLELGCACKNDLALVHYACALKWFVNHGSTVCEICECVAKKIRNSDIKKVMNALKEYEALRESTANGEPTPAEVQWNSGVDPDAVAAIRRQRLSEISLWFNPNNNSTAVPQVVNEQPSTSNILIEELVPGENTAAKWAVEGTGILLATGLLTVTLAWLIAPRVGKKTAKNGLHILLGGICALTIVIFFRFFVLTRIKYGPARYWAILFVFWFLVFGIWASRTHGAHAT